MESMNLNGQPYSASLNPTESVGRYTAKTFAWMFAGLMLTFIIALTGYVTGAVLYVFSVPYLYLALGIAELLVVIFLSARIQKMSVGTARALFFTYAVLNGVVFSAYFLIYLTTDLILVFGATSMFFGIMALIGYCTKADFSKLHSFLIGGLVFLAIFWIAAMFINLASLPPSPAPSAYFSSWCLLPMILRKSALTMHTTPRILKCLQKLLSSALCSFTWTLSTCSCIC